MTVWGHVTPLLSLGVGFNRELTGRENILLGGLTAGLSAEEVADQAWMVEEFAGLGDAIDFPMRTYSSGMFGRLAFAVAAHLNPEILLIDEALVRRRRRVQAEVHGQDQRAVRAATARS